MVAGDGIVNRIIWHRLWILMLFSFVVLGVVGGLDLYTLVVLFGIQGSLYQFLHRRSAYVRSYPVHGFVRAATVESPKSAD